MVSYAGIQPFICLNITHHGNLHSPTITGMFGSSNVAFDTSQVGVKHISSTEYRGWYVFHMEEGICGVYMKYIYMDTYGIYIYIYILMYPGYVDFPGCMLWYSVAKKKN